MTSDPLRLPDLAAWEAWLAEHHDTEAFVWLQIAKKDADVTTVTIDDALDAVLSFGWIDGHRRACAEDPRFYLQRYSPRQKRSNWSAINVAKVEVLLAEGRMRPPGLAAFDAR